MPIKKRNIILLTAAFFAAGAVISSCAVVREHGLAEGIDQAGHYLWGQSMTAKFMHQGDDPCTAKQKTMDFAIAREFRQKSAAKQQSGTWCKDGCRRDLDYWQRGIDSIAFDTPEQAASCLIEEWVPPSREGRPVSPPLLETLMK